MRLVLLMVTAKKLMFIGVIYKIGCCCPAIHYWLGVLACCLDIPACKIITPEVSVFSPYPLSAAVFSLLVVQ